MSPNLVKHPISIWHSILLSAMASGDHLLAQNLIKHLLPFYQSHCLGLLYYLLLLQLSTTASPSHLLPPVTSPEPELNDWRVKTPIYLAGQPSSYHLPASLLSHWASKASKATARLFTSCWTPRHGGHAQWANGMPWHAEVALQSALQCAPAL